MAPRAKNHKCNECGKLFRAPAELAAHLHVHSGEKRFQCTDCGNRYALRATLRVHQRTHSDSANFKCDQCGKGFTRKDCLKAHEKTHSGEKPYRCKECGTGFSQKGHLKIHQRTHTGERPFVCEICEKSFTRKRLLHQHLRVHTGEKPYQCAQCGKRFTQKARLREHLRVHTGEKPYVCEECGDAYTRKRSLTTHLRKHSGEKPFQCEQCGKVLAECSSLVSHRRIHGGAYKCAECGRPFISERRLREHMLRHTDPDQLKCVNCGRQFTRKVRLRHHKASCGSNFKCDVPECEFDAKTYVEIEDHLVRVHGRERRLKCPICNKCFTSNDGLKQHELRVHNGRYFHLCDRCGVGFGTSAKLQVHKENCNGVAAAFKGRIRQVAEKHRIEEDYELTEELVGQGLSSVLKAKGLKPADTGKEFAVKKIDVKRDTPVETRVATYRALTEARIAKSRCGHENTAGVEKVYYQDGAVYIVAKLVRPGNLLKAVTNIRLKGKLFGEAHVASIMKDILNGLGHIHGQGLLHRDMKTANVLLDENGVCMIVDFGESATGGRHRGTGVGTDGYRPPEAWGDEKQTTALDVYPLGIIATECMAMRGAPRQYEDDPPRGVIAWLRRWLGHSNRTPSSSFENFVEMCLQHDAAARPSVTVLLEHPFIKVADRSSLRELVAATI